MQMVFQTPTESFDETDSWRWSGRELNQSWHEKKRSHERGRKFAGIMRIKKEFAKRYPHEVSGGQCQRAAIARAIAIKPKLLILDEATSALDVTVQKEILELLERLREERKMSYLFICHDIALVQNFCDRVLVIHQGKIIEEGSSDEVICHPKEAYTRRLIESVL